MPAIVLQGGYMGNDIFRIEDIVHTTRRFRKVDYNQWRAANPSATKEDLEEFLGYAILLPNCQLHIRVWELENVDLGGYPLLGVTVARPGIPIDPPPTLEEGPISPSDFNE